jgi:hypothetical protein
MRYLVCACPWSGHPACRAPWVAHMLKLYHHRADVTQGIVTTDAPCALVERVCGQRPGRRARLFQCA